MICSKCKTECQLEDFHSKTRNGNRQTYTYCKDCHRSYMNQHYRENKSKYLDKAKKSNIKSKAKIYEWLREYFTTHPCVDCGEKDPIVLDFDHNDPATKINSVSRLIVNNSLDKIKEEVQKCTVRCSNCHRRKTAKQFNHYWINLKKDPYP